MKPNNNPEPFRTAIESVQRLIHQFADRGVIIGSIAVGFLGKPRFTADIDAVFLLSTDDISHFLDLARAEHIVPRIDNIEFFAHEKRVLLMKHHPTATNIDILLGMLPFEHEMVKRSSTKSFANLSIRLPTPEDLIIMKAIAHRPKDLEYIQSIVEKHPRLDTHRIEEWVKSFGRAMALPDLWDEVRTLLG
jgi:predicted nucleotidyltransferase